jgi:hypothetical protein
VPTVDWHGTRIVKVEIKGATASVVTEEANTKPEIAAIIGPDTLEYRLRRLDGVWRIYQRRLQNTFPPPKWIRYLL